MLTAQKTFQMLLDETKLNGHLFDHLENVVRPPFAFDDLLRWQWAQAVSALDKLIHDIVRIGMVQSFLGGRPPTLKFKNFELTLNHLDQMKTPGYPPEYWFELLVIQKHKLLSFQEPENISDALSNIWVENHKWQKIASSIGAVEDRLKKELKNIVQRRNQIVHQGDIDVSGSSRSPISKADTEEAIKLIEKIGNAIVGLVK